MLKNRMTTKELNRSIGLTRLILEKIREQIICQNIGVAIDLINRLDNRLGLLENNQHETVDCLEELITDDWKNKSCT